MENMCRYAILQQNGYMVGYYKYIGKPKRGAKMEWTQADRFILGMITQGFDVEVTKIFMGYCVEAFTEDGAKLAIAYFDYEGKRMEEYYEIY